MCMHIKYIVHVCVVYACQLFRVSMMGEGLGGREPTSSSVRHGTDSCGLLVLPQEDLPTLIQSTCVYTSVHV